MLVPPVGFSDVIVTFKWFAASFLVVSLQSCFSEISQLFLLACSLNFSIKLASLAPPHHHHHPRKAKQLRPFFIGITSR